MDKVKKKLFKHKSIKQHPLKNAVLLLLSYSFTQWWTIDDEELTPCKMNYQNSTRSGQRSNEIL